MPSDATRLIEASMIRLATVTGLLGGVGITIVGDP